MNDERYTLTQIAEASKISKRTLQRYVDSGIIENYQEMSATGMTIMVSTDDILAAIQKYNTGKIGKDRLNFEVVIHNLRILDRNEKGIEILDELPNEEAEQVKDQLADLEEQVTKLLDDLDKKNYVIEQASLKFLEYDQKIKDNQLLLDTSQEEREKLIKEKEEAEKLAEQIKKDNEEKEKKINEIKEFQSLSKTKQAWLTFRGKAPTV